MFTTGRGRLVALGAVVVGAAIALSGCATSNPLATGAATPAGGTLIVGSQAYYSNEIVAEIYSQALENGGFKVDRQFKIGQREVYLPEIEAGKIDVFPEYIGSLDQALNKTAAGGVEDAVYKDLTSVLPKGLRVLKPAEAADQNSWTVTEAFAKKWKLTDIASLKNVTDPIIVGGNSELETRPYGPTALKSKYGITTAGFSAVEDSGGPLTVKALVDNKIQLANIYTADPNIKSNNLVALKDPDGLFFPDNIAPVVSKKVTDKAAAILDKVDAKLSQSDLVSLNSESVNDQKSADVIAKDWLTKNGLLK
ncbi:ABC transporter substrate-binding protein [Lacisediminihabitans profunda]|uniref:ABC transporter substrate-binding protein n=1 Tax=Lacisediminihabitans profunda TaxID=2594790 RepID=A0A5C8UW96_9MICO|nr:ABC transporter substrate-binding protein [Lacisediminihabitans profunda]TXN32835.1 ABC transporter substrate-binding protein [Lacisediminihabitans profunda]